MLDFTPDAGSQEEESIGGVGHREEHMLTTTLLDG